MQLSLKLGVLMLVGWLLCTSNSQANAPRVITIGGDVTAIASALGASQWLIARDTTNTYPPHIRQLPDIGYMRQLNAEGILALKPTLILASEQASPSIVLKQLSESGVQVITIPEQPTIATIFKKIDVIAQALNRPLQAKQLRQQLQQQLDKIDTTPIKVNTLFIMGHSGMQAMVAGSDTAADAIITLAGLTNAMQQIKHYQPISQEGIIASQADLIITSQDTINSLGGEQKIWQLPGIAFTPAGQQHRLLVIDDLALLGFQLNIAHVIQQLRDEAQKIR